MKIREWQMRTRRLPLAVLLVVGLALSVSAFAWGGRPWHHMANLTPEQAGTLFDLRQKFMDDTANLRKQMWVKGAELRTLWQAEQPDEKAIVAKMKEITAMREQLMEKAVPFRLQVKKIIPKGAFGGSGMGCLMGAGPGMAMGPGGGMGMGPEGCFGGPMGPATGPGAGPSK
jgi:Spy/CpxP family protein refolding chaperone